MAQSLIIASRLIGEKHQVFNSFENCKALNKDMKNPNLLQHFLDSKIQFRVLGFLKSECILINLYVYSGSASPPLRRAFIDSLKSLQHLKQNQRSPPFYIS